MTKDEYKWTKSASNFSNLHQVHVDQKQSIAWFVCFPCSQVSTVCQRTA